MSDSSTNEAVVVPTSAPESRAAWLSVMAIVLGVLSLGVAILTPMILGAEPQPPSSTNVEKAATDVEGNVELKFRSFSLTLKRDDESTESESPPSSVLTPAPQAPVPGLTAARYMAIAGVCFALLGFAVTPFAWVREHQAALCCGAMLLCTAGLTWQYIAFGIAAGAGIAMLLVVLAIFAPAVTSG